MNSLQIMLVKRLASSADTPIPAVQLGVVRSVLENAMLEGRFDTILPLYNAQNLQVRAIARALAQDLGYQNRFDLINQMEDAAPIVDNWLDMQEEFEVDPLVRFVIDQLEGDEL